MERTNDDFFRSLIDHARQDEKRHYNEFQEMHRRLTGQYYMNNEKMVSFPKLKEGVKMAMQDELEAAESYRTMMFEIENDEDFEVLFKAMSDEVEHAIRFSTIYNAIKE
jgi:rubrerythrin